MFSAFCWWDPIIRLAKGGELLWVSVVADVKVTVVTATEVSAALTLL